MYCSLFDYLWGKLQFQHQEQVGFLYEENLSFDTKNRLVFFFLIGNMNSGIDYLIIFVSFPDTLEANWWALLAFSRPYLCLLHIHLLLTSNYLFQLLFTLNSFYFIFFLLFCVAVSHFKSILESSGICELWTNSSYWMLPVFLWLLWSPFICMYMSAFTLDAYLINIILCLSTIRILS